MWTADKWKDFEVIDCSGGEKLERWGKYCLVRPDPQVIWDTPRRDPRWKDRDARYSRSSSGGGSWDRGGLPKSWQVSYRELTFNIKPMNFKHTGLFPEQAANWDWMRERLKDRPQARVLNLFAYTGGATLACMMAGAHVTHVDAAKGMVRWAKENRELTGAPEDRCRFITEDAKSFVQRELRRGRRYEGILMDPPSYGRGPTGEVWKLEDALFPLVELCAQLLSDQPLFFLLNGYTTGFQPTVLGNVLRQTVCRLQGGQIDSQELCLPVSSGGFLPAGASGRWQP